MTTYQAYVVDQPDGRFVLERRRLQMDALQEGEVLIRVQYSSINYKDGLATLEQGKVVKQYPMVPGIDLAGIVAASRHPDYKPNDLVLATGYGLGVEHPGGYAELARVPGDWLIPLPAGLGAREAMVLGTAGLTAALCIDALEQAGIRPDHGPVLVTGATGGVGSLAIAMLAKLGYTVEASTGKMQMRPMIERWGATRIWNREEVCPDTIKPLGKQQWAAAVDTVGGQTLAHVLSSIRYGGAVAACGLTGGAQVPTTVFPFILRGVRLIGIDSVWCSRELRLRMWKRMAGEWKPPTLEDIAREITFAELPENLAMIQQGHGTGRTVVRIGNPS